MFDSFRFADVTFLLLLNCSRALNIWLIRLDELTASIIDVDFDCFNDVDFDRDEYSSTIIALKEIDEIIVDLKNDEITVRLEDDRWNNADVLNKMSFLIESIDLSFENESTSELTDWA